MLGLLGIAAIAGAGWQLRSHLIRHVWGMSPTRFVQVPHGVGTLMFAGEGQTLLTAEKSARVTNKGGPIGQVTFWDVASGRKLRQWREDGEQFCFADDGQRVLTTSHDFKTSGSHFALRHAATGKALRQWTGGAPVSVLGDLSLMVIVDTPWMGLTRKQQENLIKQFRRTKAEGISTVRLVEVATGRLRGQLTCPTSDAIGTRLSRNGRYLSVPGIVMPKYQRNGQLLRVSDLKPLLPLPPVWEVRISQDGREVRGIGQDDVLHFWELPSRQHTTVKTGLKGVRWTVRLSNENLLVAGLKGSDKTYRSVTQVRSKDGSQVLHEFNGELVANTVDGRWLAFQVPREDNA